MSQTLVHQNDVIRMNLHSKFVLHLLGRQNIREQSLVDESSGAQSLSQLLHLQNVIPRGYALWAL